MDYDIIKKEDNYVFFLHGWGGDKNSFLWLKNHIVKNYSMVFVSFSGFGKSPPPQKPYFINDYVEELKELILNIAKDKKVSLVCHSFGARVAIKLVNNYPDLIDRLVIVDGAGIKPKRRLKYYINVLRYKIAKKQVKKGKLNKKVLDKFGSSDYKNLNGTMKATFVNVVNENLTNQLKNVHCKTLIFWGEVDKETPLYMAKIMNKKIKNSKLIIIKGAGHFSYIDDKDAFIYALNDFLF